MERTAEGGGRRATVAGWAALGLAALLAAWAAAPLLQPGGPDLAGLRPRMEEAARAAAGSGGSTESPRRPPKASVLPAEPLDLNRATAAELTALPGIGPVTAARIVEYRRAMGPFPRAEALRGVPGIGPKRFERIAPHVTVGAASHAAQPERAGEEDRPRAAEPASAGGDRPRAAEPASAGGDRPRAAEPASAGGEKTTDQ